MRFSPFLARPASVSRIMLYVLGALLPGLAVYVHFYGAGILLQIGLATAACYLFEATCLHLRRVALRPFLLDGSALVTAWLIALSLPSLAPWWLVVVASFFAIVVAKHLYGGLGNNVFNPAMVGFAVVIVSFPAQLSQWAAPHGPLSAMEQFRYILTRELPGGMSFDAIAQATPLDFLKTQLAAGHDLLVSGTSPIFGLLAGVGSEWVALAWLAGGLALLAARVISWQAPVALLATLGLLSGLFHLIDPARYASPVLHMFAGATMLGAWFIATDPVSGSTTPRGKLVFGAGAGLCLWVIRTFGSFPDAMAFSVLMMNMAVPLIDRYTQPPVFGHKTARGRP